MARAKKRKHPKLPNGFGSIKYLGANRSNPYAVHPPTTEFAPNGSPITPKAICYAPDWYTGFYALLAWQKGEFNENIIEEIKINSEQSEFDVVSKILAVYNASSRNAKEGKTFTQIYEEYFDYKYNRDKTRNYSAQSKQSTKAAFKNCSQLHDKIFSQLSTADLQKVVDDCPLKHASKELIVSLFKQMYAYAEMNDLCNKDYSAYVKINTADDDEQGVPFSPEELETIWRHKDDSSVYRGILIMIYSGFRIAAYSKLEINLDEKYFCGGVKTAAGKNRIVPFCAAIEPFIDKSMELFNARADTFRKLFTSALNEIGITGHTPHDCRHTFSWLCDKYHVDTLSKKMLMGHALGTDVTDSKYGHRTIEELRAEINKIVH